MPSRIVGFIVVRRAADEAEVINLAVNPAHQRLGVGKALLTEARKRLVQAEVIRLFLEVRTSNAPALALYHSLGFAAHSVRQDYYRDPLEDAQILCLELHAGRGLSS
jgi:ribosomal-protein-alanine N-acetyltransferase